MIDVLLWVVAAALYLVVGGWVARRVFILGMRETSERYEPRCVHTSVSAYADRARTHAHDRCPSPSVRRTDDYVYTLVCTAVSWPLWPVVVVSALVYVGVSRPLFRGVSRAWSVVTAETPAERERAERRQLERDVARARDEYGLPTGDEVVRITDPPMPDHRGVERLRRQHRELVRLMDRLPDGPAPGAPHQRSTTCSCGSCILHRRVIAAAPVGTIHVCEADGTCRTL